MCHLHESGRIGDDHVKRIRWTQKGKIACFLSYIKSIFKQMHTIHVILVLEWRYHMDMGKYISYIQWINVS